MANSSQGSSALPSYVKPAILRFKELEKKFLGGLSDEEKKLLARGVAAAAAGVAAAAGGACCLCLLTLGGLKPCMLLDHGASSTFAGDLTAKCLHPVMQEFQLESHGFQLHHIAHRLLTSNPVHSGFQGGYVFVNMQHPQYALVRDVFLKPRPAPIPELLIGSALGYPLPSGDGKVTYVDASEMEAAGVCCVDLLEYFCDKYPSQCPKVLLHFGNYSDFWEKLGWRLTMNMEKCSGVEQFWHKLRRDALSGRA